MNGCQTSNEIFNCKKYASEIFVSIKIIYTIDPDIISHIVKATNRQSPVSEEAFVALDKYHKELQLLFSEYSKEMPLEMLGGVCTSNYLLKSSLTNFIFTHIFCGKEKFISQVNIYKNFLQT